MLQGVLASHEGALRASLQEVYGLRLLRGGGGRTEPFRTPFELTDLVEHLPSGCALGRALGGEGALSNESLLLREVEFTLRSLSFQEHGAKGKPPERITLPRSVDEARAADVAMSAKARAWQARQARRNVPVE